MIGAYLMVPPGSATLQYSWTSPYAADADETGGVYRLTIQKQPGLLPGPLDLTIRVPEGFRITDASEGLTVSRRDRHAPARPSSETSNSVSPTRRPTRPPRSGCSHLPGYTRADPTIHQGEPGRPWNFVSSSPSCAPGSGCSWRASCWRARRLLVSSSLPKVYESTATLLVGQSIQSANPDLNQLWRASDCPRRTRISRRRSRSWSRSSRRTSSLSRPRTSRADRRGRAARLDARPPDRQGRRPGAGGEPRELPRGRDDRDLAGPRRAGAEVQQFIDAISPRRRPRSRTRRRRSSD